MPGYFVQTSKQI